MGAEAKVEGYLRDEVKALGGWMEKHVSPGTKGPPDNIVMWAPDPHHYGPLDFCGNIWPSVEFIETKAPNGRLTVLQKRDHARRRAMGFLVHVLWNFELAEAYLRSRGKR